jgi:uncharacterized protein YuzE
MKITYDAEADILFIALKDHQVEESDEDPVHGVIYDCGSDGQLISLQILNASEVVTNLSEVEYEIIGERGG